MSNFMVNGPKGRLLAASEGEDSIDPVKENLRTKVKSLRTAIQRIRDTMPSKQNRTKVDPKDRLTKQKRINTLEEQILQLRDRELRLRKEN